MSLTSLVLHKPRPAINLGQAVIRRLSSTHKLECVSNEAPATLFFDSLESALSFRRFMEIYIGDRAPGNSYSGYFPDWDRREPKPSLPPLRTSALDQQLILQMTHAICGTRLCVHGFALELNSPVRERARQLVQDARPRITSKFGVNSFAFDEKLLPPRLPPEKFGDLVRVTDDPALRRIDGFFIASRGESVVIALHAPRDGLPELVAVNREKVMRIFNYRRDIQHPPGLEPNDLALLERMRKLFESQGAQKLEGVASEKPV